MNNFDSLPQSGLPSVTMPKVTPSLMEKIMLIRLREGWRGTEIAGPKFGVNGATLRGYEGGHRRPGRFARLHLERCVAAYESGGVDALAKVVADASTNEDHA